MFTLTIKELIARKMRFLSTVFAVLLGVTLMAGTLVLTDTLEATFDSVAAEAHAGVDAVVRNPSAIDLSYGMVGTRMSADVIDTIRRVDGVDRAAVEVTGYAQIVGHDGNVVGDQAQAGAFGFNWIDVPDLNPYRLAEGHAPTNDTDIVIDRGSATEADLHVGDVVTVLTQQAPAEFTIAGIVTFGTVDSPAGATAVLFADAVAGRYLASPGMVDGVVVHATDGVSQTELVARLDAVVPNLEVVTGAEAIAADQAAFATSFAPFKLFLLIFAFIALFVGAFMINNTFSITVAQRTQQLAVLRALGASRRQVLRTVLIEAFAVGLTGSVAGLGAGIALAAGLRQMFAVVGAQLPDGPMVISMRSMTIAVLVGIAVTVVSAWLPARRAGRVLPIASLRELSVDRSGSSLRRALTGSVVTALGAAVLIAGLSGAGAALVGLGALACLIGVAVLGPVLASPVTSVFGAVVGRRGITGDMAVRNAKRNPQRTARTAASLMIGVAMVVFIAVFAASAKTSIGGSLEQTFTGSHIVDSGAYDGRGGFSPNLAADMRDDRNVDAVTESRVNPAAVDGTETDLYGFTAATVGDMFDLGHVTGDMSHLGADGIAVEAGYANERGWTIGTPVEITLASGIQTFVVRATFDNASEWVGNYFVDVAAFDAYLPDQLDYRIYTIGDDAAVRSLAIAYPSTAVLDAHQYLHQVTGEIDTMLGVVYALLALAVIIALLGISNTLALSIFERTRELGLLRAVGMTQPQVRSIIRWEAIMIALFGTSLGLAIGSFFGWVGVRALRSEGIDRLTYPIGTLVTITVIAAMAGAVAAVAPARRASRLDVLDALSAN